MTDHYRLPNLTEPDLGRRLDQLHSYLRQLVEQMNLERRTRNTESGAAVQTGAAPIGAYPPGALYLSTEAASPKELFGGNWERVPDALVLAAGDDYPPGTSGTLAGAGDAAPWLAVYVWKRIG